LVEQLPWDAIVTATLTALIYPTIEKLKKNWPWMSDEGVYGSVVKFALVLAGALIAVWGSEALATGSFAFKQEYLTNATPYALAAIGLKVLLKTRAKARAQNGN